MVESGPIQEAMLYWKQIWPAFVSNSKVGLESLPFYQPFTIPVLCSYYPSTTFTIPVPSSYYPNTMFILSQYNVYTILVPRLYYTSTTVPRLYCPSTMLIGTTRFILSQYHVLLSQYHVPTIPVPRSTIPVPRSYYPSTTFLLSQYHFYTIPVPRSYYSNKTNLTSFC